MNANIVSIHYITLHEKMQTLELQVLLLCIIIQTCYWRASSYAMLSMILVTNIKLQNELYYDK